MNVSRSPKLDDCLRAMSSVTGCKSTATMRMSRRACSAQERIARGTSAAPVAMSRIVIGTSDGVLEMALEGLTPWGREAADCATFLGVCGHGSIGPVPVPRPPVEEGPRMESAGHVDTVAEFVKRGVARPGLEGEFPRDARDF